MNFFYAVQPGGSLFGLQFSNRVDPAVAYKGPLHAYVSSLQGEPRSTHDIDMVVAIQKSVAKVLIQSFPSPDFYLDEDGIRETIDKRSMFNLIDVASGDKVDFWILTDEPFDQSRFSRKISEEFMGLKMHVSKPEDTILAKLRWAKLSGGSEKQFTDALRVYEVQYVEFGTL